MSVAATRVSPFSAGLWFSSKGAEDSALDTAANKKKGVSHGGPQSVGRVAPREEVRCFESEEERLLWKAGRLRLSIETDLIRRQEAVEKAVRHGRRQLMQLQRLLPTMAFLAFRQKCAAWHDRVHLFEELVVHAILKNAVDSAVRSGEVTEPGRWRKSNQWPTITNLLQLQLHLCFTVSCCTAVQAIAADQLSCETCAVYRHLAALWADHQERVLTRGFLDRYYTLRDALHGWGNGWYARAWCVDEDDNIRSTPGSPLPSEVSDSCTCPFSSWESLSAVDRLTSYSKMCPRHLTEDVVQSLETLLVTYFEDVWFYVESVISGARK
ncbi:hypothetical protein, conserved [Leishmania lindenbergi]|uniref:Uncharacterized protein n=1 Tax=Leishmania lindenbergi TaxID=651832 RepID=A0AAW2ZRK6_9TRYP